MLRASKQKYVWICQGILSPPKLHPIILEIIRTSGMTPARNYRLDFYPYLNRGGYGYTLYQPLMESYIIADVYYIHNETEILLSTCKPERMNEASILDLLQDKIGPTERYL